MSAGARTVLIAAGALLAAQLAVVHGSFYLATDDWLMVTFGRQPVDLARLFERQTVGTPAVRPLSLLLTHLEHLLAGDAAGPRLALNLGWHAAASAMLFLMLHGLFGHRRRAAVAALLFLAWPLHGETLAWYHGGHTMLPVAFLTLGVLAAYARVWPLWVGLGLLVLALLTRENAVAAGPLLLAMAWRRRGRLGEAVREVWPYLALLALYVGVRAWQVLGALASEETATLPLGQSLWRTLGYLGFHLVGPVHPGIPGAWVWLGACVAGAAVVLWRGRSFVAPALLWVVVFCLPFAPLYDTGDPLFEVFVSAYERRWYHLYLPAAGVAWLVACVVWRHRWATAAAVVGLAALQLMNAHWYAGLGADLRRTHAQITALVGTRQALTLLHPPTETLLGELVEHQVVDIPRVWPGHPAPVYRQKSPEDGSTYVRAVLDPFGYPTWQNLPEDFRPPDGTLQVRWDDARKQLVW